ncbi:MAG: hypothetical protein NTY39_07395 [Campylobacterales bacterium]|nr:hypothetical protein [Campylobacterales bacterium]
MSSKNKQELLISYFKSLNKVFKLEIQKDNDELLTQQLTKVAMHISDIFCIDEKEHFEDLMISKNLENNSFSWDYNNYSIALTELMKLYKTTYIGAIDKESKSLWLQIALNMDDLLETLTPSKENKKDFINYESFLNIFFQYHREIFEYSLNKKSIYRDSLGFHWYTSHVFNWIRKNQQFNLDFLPLYDKIVFEYIRFAIDNNDIDFFKDLIEWFHSGIGFYGHSSDLYDFVNYNDFDEQIDFNNISKLDEQFLYLNTREALDQWLTEFDHIKKIVLEKESKDEEAKEIIKKAHDQFLFSNLKELVHGIGAYLVKRQKYDWIIFLWTFKQPEDADASWAGHSILPESIDEFILSLKDRGYYPKFDFHEGHSSSSYYYRQYDLYLLLHLLSYSDNVPNISLSNKDERYIANLKFYIQKLENELDKIFTQNNILAILEIKADKEKLSNFLQNIKNECEKGLVSHVTNAKIKPERVQKLKDSFFESYRKSSGLKKIVQNYTKQYQEIDDKNDQTFGINTLLAKDSFNSDLVMGIDMFGSQFARDITEGENRKILDLVVPKCETLEEKEFSNAVKKVNDLNDAFIIAFGSFKFIMNNNSFEGAWRDPSDELKAFSSFEGRYIIDHYRIPVFRIFYGQVKNRVLILNKKKFISIRQLDVDNSENNFDIDVHEISDSLKQSILEKIGTQEAKDAKEKELSQRVHLELYENFEVTIDENFEGYIVDL